jgi:hypothetical protein
VSAPNPTSLTIGFLYLAIALILILLGAVGVIGKPLLAAVMFRAFSCYGLNDISD